MSSFFKLLGAMIVLAAVVYFLIAFVELRWNLLSWSRVSRLCLGLTCTVSLISVLLGAYTFFQPKVPLGDPYP